MTIPSASYDFGFRAVRLIRYVEGFLTSPVDPSGKATFTAEQIKAALIELEDSLAILAPELESGGVQAVQMTLHRLTGYAKQFADVACDFAGDDRQILGRFIDLPFVATWRTLISVAAATTRKHPRLHCWYELGATMAQLLSQTGTLRHSASVELPSLEPLIRAVAALPPPLAGRVIELDRLRQVAEDGAWNDQNPIDVLRPVVNHGTTATNAQEASFPPWPAVGRVYGEGEAATTLLLMLHVLHWQIRWRMRLITRGRDLTLRTTGAAHFHAVLDAIPYPLTEAQFCILQSLLKANGQYRKREVIKQEHGALLISVKIELEVAALPPPIRSLIDSKQARNGGYLLSLD